MKEGLKGSFELPLFPLSTVLFPGGRLPLRIFEQRHLRMVSACARADREFGIVLEQSSARGSGKPIFHDLGTTARVVDFDRLEGGLLGVLCLGGSRFRVQQHRVEHDGLIVGQVEMLEDDPPTETPAEYKAAADLLRRCDGGLPPALREPKPRWEDAGWLASRLAERLPIPMELKHELLSLNDPAQRLDVLFALLQAQELV